MPMVSSVSSMSAVSSMSMAMSIPSSQTSTVFVVILSPIGHDQQILQVSIIQSKGHGKDEKDNS